MLQGPDLLTVGNFGMERSVIALILCTSAGVVLVTIAMCRAHIVPSPWQL